MVVECCAGYRWKYRPQQAATSRCIVDSVLEHTVGMDHRDHISSFGGGIVRMIEQACDVFV